MNHHLARPFDYSKQVVSKESCPVQQKDHTAYAERFCTRLAPITSMKHIYNPVPKHHPNNIVEEYPNRYERVPVDTMYGKDTSLFDEAGKRLSFHRKIYPLHDMNVQNKAIYKRDADGNIKRIVPKFIHHKHDSKKILERFPEHYGSDIRAIYSTPENRDSYGLKSYENSMDIDTRVEILPIRHATVPRPKHGSDIYSLM